MNVYNATEIAYKRGYDKGYNDGVEETLKNSTLGEKGHWIFEDGWITCSNCGCQPYKNENKIDFNNLYKKCPNCKATMD